MKFQTKKNYKFDNKLNPIYIKFNVYDKHEKSYKLLAPLKKMLIFFFFFLRERENANLVTDCANFDQTTPGYLTHIYLDTVHTEEIHELHDDVCCCCCFFFLNEIFKFYIGVLEFLISYFLIPFYYFNGFPFYHLKVYFKK